MKLIKFVEQNIAVPNEWNKPYYRTLEHEGLKDPIGIYDESITTMPLQNAKTVDYEMVMLRDGKKEWRFYVNFEEAKLVLPMLEGIVNNQTRKIRKENMDLTMLNMQLQSVVKKYRSYWFNRFWSWLKERLSFN